MRTPLLAALCSLALPGCSVGKICTQMYAPDNLQIDFDPALTETGTWTVDITGSDGFVGQCVLALPAADPNAAVCDDASTLLVSADGLAIDGIVLSDAAPPTVTVTLSLDGTEVASGDLTPTYAVDEPNGEGCGERSSAVETFATGG